MKTYVSIFLTLFLSISLNAQEEQSRFKPYGMVRVGFHTISRDDRDSSIATTNELRLRLQLGLRYRLTDKFTINARFAGRFSTEQESWRFLVTDHILPGKDGLLLGQSTIDELNFSYLLSDAFRIRVGRFQTKFELEGVPKKSLDRSDSPNTDINWTDGIHLSYTTPFGWAAHFIAQHNSKNGSSNILRPPLSFEHAASRISYYAIFEEVKSNTIFAQRELSATYIPKSITSANENPDDLFALVARLAVAHRIGENSKILIGGEGGVANNAPSKLALKTGNVNDGQGGRIAFQVSVNVLDIFKKHNIGAVYGNIDDGWLISPDLRSNNIEKEIRHQWKITKKLSMENRIRWRTDKEQQVGALKKREDVDLYFRLSFRI